MLNKSEWLKVGHVDVDAGLVHVGDPCYISDGKNYAENWSAFCDWLDLNEDEVTAVSQVKHESENPGKAVVLGGFGGDGSYGVYIRRNHHGMTAQVLIDFAGDLSDD
jgi:hypothetical protein